MSHERQRADLTATLRRAPPPPPLAAVIRVLGAKASPARFLLSGGKCVVGAGPSSDIIISSPMVSRSHLELTLAPEGVGVRDLGSRNGTFYLGQRIEKMMLMLGSRVRAGDVEIALDPDTESLQALGEADCGYRGLVGTSAVMRRLFALLIRLEGSLVNVLIEGESGVGKELVARALHEGSGLAHQRLVIVNCGGVARELVTSELFGHRRGAFTGAVESRTGAFEAADGGTLFFDEIGELPLDVQPVLLRALETGEVQAVGDGAPKKVRVRVIAATNRDLEQEMRCGRFREDLFYRIAVMRLKLAPLRQRPEDIEVLARLFAAGLGVPELPAEFIDRLTRHTWPGNARELRNAVQTFVAVGALPEETQPLLPALEQALKEVIDIGRPYAEQKELVADHFARTYLKLLLAHTAGNQSEAARISGMDRTYLGRLLVKLGIGKP
jgi:two-component system, NtrC family, nitrogen regulation response regulator GlnG